MYAECIEEKSEQQGYTLVYAQTFRGFRTPVHYDYGKGGSETSANIGITINGCVEQCLLNGRSYQPYFI